MNALENSNPYLLQFWRRRAHDVLSVHLAASLGDGLSYTLKNGSIKASTKQARPKRGDEQAGICQSEDGEGILVDPVHALPNLKALLLSAVAQRSRFGPGWVGLYAISVDYSST
jgi:hypothetical protein